MTKNHVHPSGITKIVNGKKYHGIKESKELFVSADGTFLTRFNKDTTFRGTDDGGQGHYFGIKINRKSFKAHRVIFETLSNSEIPDSAEIDHIDGNPRNNSFDNLRVVGSRTENMRNPITLQRLRNWLDKLHNDPELESRRKENQRVYAKSEKSSAKLRALGMRRAIPVISIDSSGNKRVFESQIEAARCLDLDSSLISGCLSGKHKSTGGYRFTRADKSTVSS